MKLLSKLSLVTLSVLTAFTIALPTGAFADAVEGETVVTLGKDLTLQQQDSILAEMKVPSNVNKIYVTNQEEHQYLGKYMPAGQIGTRALSSAKITIAAPGSGISVKTNNITYITDAMYANAAITAGVKDADIYVTAPIRVSGTAGLTGIIKAFEQATGKPISENQKQVANQEIVTTQDVAKDIGGNSQTAGNQAAQFMNNLKQEIATQKPTTPQEYRDIIVNVAGDLNINLNQTTINQLVQYGQAFSTLDIDYSQLSDQISKLRGSLSNILSVNPQGFFDTIFEWLGSLFSAIGDFFTSSSSRQ
ncbi:DUF1002 domain-containing protein [Shimazuella sp. AN120528]|uniref:DUF1002 domain-containing protein n=1 Tax=Shimazuella soli TaxID=1892854 RepID=UPI001F0FCBF9|nr:DUF1002 domain-containing protein [Shimazuella soli]MCH5584565.1 DUF1002 domain-containing protein [Shimazuella soli]